MKEEMVKVNTALKEDLSEMMKDEMMFKMMKEEMMSKMMKAMHMNQQTNNE
jgi:hypothetical protein